jgi:hypothetical protein
MCQVRSINKILHEKYLSLLDTGLRPSRGLDILGWSWCNKRLPRTAVRCYLYHVAIALFLVCARISLASNCSRVNDTRYRDVCKQFWSDADLPLSSGLYSMLGRAIGFRHLTSRYDIISLYGISLVVILFLFLMVG